MLIEGKNVSNYVFYDMVELTLSVLIKVVSVMVKKYLKNVLELYCLNDLIAESIIISFSIIALDCINFFSFIIDNNSTFLIFLFVLFLVVIFCKKKTLSMIFKKNINAFDKLAIIFPLSIILCWVYCLFDFKLYKLYMLLGVYCFMWILWCIRIYICSTNEFVQNSTVYDLKYIYNRPIILEEGKIALVDDEAVDYDLLNRNNLINHLYNVIIKCFSKNKFTIGLNGKWGCGKSTIIKNVLNLIKNNDLLDDFLIIEFDPWKYDDDKSILKGFLSEIFEKIDFDFNAEQIDILIEAVTNIIFDNKTSDFLKLFTNELSNIRKKTKIENIVNNYLKSNNKRLLIIIDNLDRINGDKAIFLIKCIETIVNFDNSIYLLLYDEELLNEMLNKMFFTQSNKYMDKIVQLKIDMPQNDSALINKIKNRVVGNIVIGGKSILEDLDRDEFEFENLRELKRYINSILSSRLSFNDKLNVSDSANLLYIKIVNPSLYYEIWNNKKYFVSYDTVFAPDIHTFDIDKLEEEAKEYFDNLFLIPKNIKLKKTLMSMFPTVNNYFKKNENLYDRYKQNNYNESICENRISNARYFDLYFTGDENMYVKVSNDTKKLVTIINTKKDFIKIIKKIINNYTNEELNIFLEVLFLDLKYISNNKYYELCGVLFDFLCRYDDIPREFVSSVPSKICSILSELILALKENEFDMLIYNWKYKYKYLHIFRRIDFYYRRNQQNATIYKNNFGEFYDELCSKILYNSINIYAEQNYSRGNIWALYAYNNDSTKKYLNNIINNKNIYKFIADFVIISATSDGYIYSFDKNSFNNLVGNINVDFLLKNYVGKITFKERFLKQIYDSYVQTSGDCEIHTDDFININ